jgi:hypothetical protein
MKLMNLCSISGMFADVFNNVFFQCVHFSCFNLWLMITSLKAVLLRVTEYNAADIFLLLIIPRIFSMSL